MKTWSNLHKLIERFYAKVQDAGRPPIGLARMLRLYVAQQCFGLSDASKKISTAARPFALSSSSIRQQVGTRRNDAAQISSPVGAKDLMC
jgi:hypothetical protein